jgi:hypothetical protein
MPGFELGLVAGGSDIFAKGNVCGLLVVIDEAPEMHVYSKSSVIYLSWIF